MDRPAAFHPQRPHGGLRKAESIPGQAMGGNRAFALRAGSRKLGGLGSRSQAAPDLGRNRSLWHGADPVSASSGKPRPGRLHGTGGLKGLGRGNARDQPPRGSAVPHVAACRRSAAFVGGHSPHPAGIGPMRQLRPSRGSALGATLRTTDIEPARGGAGLGSRSRVRRPHSAGARRGTRRRLGVPRQSRRPDVRHALQRRTRYAPSWRRVFPNPRGRGCI